MTTDIDKTVLELLEARRGDWQALATASGISYSWLSKFANGHIDNPGFATLKKLHYELTKQPKTIEGQPDLAHLAPQEAA